MPKSRNPSIFQRITAAKLIDQLGNKRYKKKKRNYVGYIYS